MHIVEVEETFVVNGIALIQMMTLAALMERLERL